MLDRFRPHLLYLLASLLAAGLMITNQSLWIDEGQTLIFARQPSLAAWADALVNNRKSEALMPLSMFLAWVGGQTLGTGEWQLRAVNALWIALAGLALGLTGRRLRLPLLLPVFLVHPFVWYYTNEARPYALQLAAAAWLLHGMALWLEPDRTDFACPAWILMAAAVVGFSSSLLFAFALAATATTLWLIRPHSLPASLHNSRSLPPLLIGFAMLGALGVYYLLSLRQGASGARIWRVSPVNLGFSFYELLGFAGLGPPRDELREGARAGSVLGLFVQHGSLAGVVWFALVCVAVTLPLWNARRQPLVLWPCLCIATQCALLVAASVVQRFPFWGRHLAPALPFVVLLAVVGIKLLKEKAARRRRALLIALVLGLVASSLRLRWMPAYGKDDYRSTCRLARSAVAAGRIVWYSGDPETLAYYGLLDASGAPSDRRLFLCYRETAAGISKLPPPDVVILSKPDIHDPDHALLDDLSRRRLTLLHRYPGFTILARDKSLVDPGWF